MLANSRRVKPVAHLHVDQRFKGFAAVFRPLLLPDLPNTFHIALSEVGGIGLAAVGDELQRCVGAGAGHLAVEIHRNDHHGADAPGLHHLNQLPAAVADGGVDIGRAGHGMDEIQRLFALLLKQYADPQPAGVEVNAVAEDKQQQQGDHHRDQPTAGIAHNLPGLFDAQGADPPPGENAIAHGYSPCPSG